MVAGFDGYCVRVAALTVERYHVVATSMRSDSGMERHETRQSGDILDGKKYRKNNQRG